MASSKHVTMSEDIVSVEKQRKLFAEARDEMVNIYHALRRAIDGLMGIDGDKKILTQLKEKVKRISEIITRSKMKAVVFGRTSSGKSALINALLGEKVLPSLCGETTVGFLMIEGTDEKDARAVTETNGVKSDLTIEEFKERCNMLQTGKMHSEEIHLYWPKSKCDLLRNDVVIVDCPGTCTTKSTDDKVRRFCEDADVYLFVVSAISSLDEEARNFFKHVANFISKPEILVVFSFWDIAQAQMDEEDQERVLKQHKDRATSLLKDELDLKIEVEDRIFFVSSTEILKPDSKGKLPKWEKRQEQFYRMECIFQHKLSVSAMQTKFQNRCEKGAKIAQTIEEQQNIVRNHLEKTKKMLADENQERKKKLQEFTEKEKEFLDRCEMEKANEQDELSKKIKSMLEDIFKEFGKDVDKGKYPEDFLKDINEKMATTKKKGNEKLESIFNASNEKLKTKINKSFSKVMPAEMIADGSLGTSPKTDTSTERKDLKLDERWMDVRGKANSARKIGAASTVAAGAGWLGGVLGLLTAAAPALVGGALVASAAGTLVSHLVKRNFDFKAKDEAFNSAVSDMKKCFDETAKKYLDEFDRSYEEYMQTVKEKCGDYRYGINRDFAAVEKQIKEIDSSIRELEQQKKHLESLRKDLQHFNDKFIDKQHWLAGMAKRKAKQVYESAATYLSNALFVDETDSAGPGTEL